MDKSRLIYLGLVVAILLAMASTVLKIKQRYDFQQKLLLAREIHKVLGVLMVELPEARAGSLREIPADGQWHEHLAFNGTHGSLEYVVRHDHLFRIEAGQAVLIADHIKDLRARHEAGSPDILEVQIQAQNTVSLVSNLKMRLQE